MYCFTAATCLLPRHFRKESASTMYRTRSKAWKGLVIKLIQAAIRFIASKTVRNSYLWKDSFPIPKQPFYFNLFSISVERCTVTPRNRCTILAVWTNWSKMEPWEWKSGSFSMVFEMSAKETEKQQLRGDEQLLRISLGKIVAHHERLRAYQPVLNRRVETRAFSK